MVNPIRKNTKYEGLNEGSMNTLNIHVKPTATRGYNHLYEYMNTFFKKYLTKNKTIKYIKSYVFRALPFI